MKENVSLLPVHIYLYKKIKLTHSLILYPAFQYDEEKANTIQLYWNLESMKTKTNKTPQYKNVRNIFI